MNKQGDKGVTPDYDPTGSGINNEIAKPVSGEPPARKLTQEEKERADRVLGDFDRERKDQRNTPGAA